MNRHQQGAKTLVRQDNPDDAGFTAPGRVPAETLVKKDSPDDVRRDEKKTRPKD